MLDDACVINELRRTTANEHMHSRDIVLISIDTQQRHSSDIGEGASHVKYTWMSHREWR